MNPSAYFTFRGITPPKSMTSMTKTGAASQGATVSQAHCQKPGQILDRAYFQTLMTCSNAALPETPSIQTPSVQTPATQTPAIQTPGIQAPAFQDPNFQPSETWPAASQVSARGTPNTEVDAQTATKNSLEREDALFAVQVSLETPIRPMAEGSALALSMIHPVNGVASKSGLATEATKTITATSLNEVMTRIRDWIQTCPTQKAHLPQTLRLDGVLPDTQLVLQKVDGTWQVQFACENPVQGSRLQAHLPALVAQLARVTTDPVQLTLNRQLIAHTDKRDSRKNTVHART